jgi:SAM-dependent methyltransferase
VSSITRVLSLLIFLGIAASMPAALSCSRSQATSSGGHGATSPSSVTSPTSQAPPLKAPDVPYEPSEPEVVTAMLRLGDVRPSDVVYDLGCGDGRIVIAAARLGARGVCIDIDPVRIRESRRNAERAGVEDRIEFRTQDLFDADLSQASVVMLFLWPEINLRLQPKLLRELAPGTRIVSHWHDMGKWVPAQVVPVVAEEQERPIYLWKVPPR